MKKILLTVALVLAIVSSLTAGTMAMYTKTLDTVSDNVKAKTFKIAVTAKEFMDVKANKKISGVKIAPGESVWYHFVVENKSGSDGISADIDATVELIGELAQVCEVELFRTSNSDLFKEKGSALNSKSYWENNGDSINTELIKVDGLVKKVGIRYVNIGIGSSENKAELYAKVTWPANADNAKDTSMVMENGVARTNPATLQLSVDVNATSHDAGVIYYANGKDSAVEAYNTNDRTTPNGTDLIRDRLAELTTAPQSATWDSVANVYRPE